MADPLTRSLMINAPIDTVYQLWADFESFPLFMQHIERVTKDGDLLSHWVMRGPFGSRLEWDARTTRLEGNKCVAWNSLDGSDLKTSGQVLFCEKIGGVTEMTVTLRYVLPFGKIGGAMAYLLDNPGQKLAEDLHNFQRYAEQREARARAVGGRP